MCEMLAPPALARLMTLARRPRTPAGLTCLLYAREALAACGGIADVYREIAPDAWAPEADPRLCLDVRRLYAAVERFAAIVEDRDLFPIMSPGDLADWHRDAMAEGHVCRTLFLIPVDGGYRAYDDECDVTAPAEAIVRAIAQAPDGTALDGLRAAIGALPPEQATPLAELHERLSALPHPHELWYAGYAGQRTQPDEVERMQRLLAAAPATRLLADGGRLLAGLPAPLEDLGLGLRYMAHACGNVFLDVGPLEWAECRVDASYPWDGTVARALVAEWAEARPIYERVQALIVRLGRDDLIAPLVAALAARLGLGGAP